MYWKTPKKRIQCRPEGDQLVLRSSAVESRLQINGLKSRARATHYPPPTNPLSSLALPKLHINLKEVTHFSSTVTLMLPCKSPGPHSTQIQQSKSLQLLFCASSESLIELHTNHYIVFCHAARLLHLDVPHSRQRPRPKWSEQRGTSMGNISVWERVCQSFSHFFLFCLIV